MPMREWVRFPTAWIVEDNGLERLRWSGPRRSDNIAALMLLAVVAHHADDQTGIARVTYDRLAVATGLSRAKISGGLAVLEQAGLILREVDGRSSYQVSNYDPTRGWGKLPAKHLYGSDGAITAFLDFHLRRRAELDALKLYYVIVAFRDNSTNMTNISYDKVNEYAGIHRAYIKSGQSLLVSHGLIHVEYTSSGQSDTWIRNRYRLVGLSSRQHMGTTGRRLISEGLIGDEFDA
jgi:DNA-binding transcriptional ArsR family regulator